MRRSAWLAWLLVLTTWPTNASPQVGATRRAVDTRLAVELDRCVDFFGADDSRALQIACPRLAQALQRSELAEALPRGWRDQRGAWSRARLIDLREQWMAAKTLPRGADPADAAVIEALSTTLRRAARAVVMDDAAAQGGIWRGLRAAWATTTRDALVRMTPSSADATSARFRTSDVWTLVAAATATLLVLGCVGVLAVRGWTHLQRERRRRRARAIPAQSDSTLQLQSDESAQEANAAPSTRFWSLLESLLQQRGVPLASRAQTPRELLVLSRDRIALAPESLVALAELAERAMFAPQAPSESSTRLAFDQGLRSLAQLHAASRA